jgi:CheY-like chemotaxis protein
MGAVPLQRPELDEPQGVQPRTVLLVDDDEDMRLYLRSCLRSNSAPFERVIEAADGLEALRLLRSEPIELVITDIGLPGLDGRRLTRAIRDDTRLNHVSVLLISGEAVIADGDADGFLSKPFNSRQLSAAIDRLPNRGTSP